MRRDDDPPAIVNLGNPSKHWPPSGSRRVQTTPSALFMMTMRATLARAFDRLPSTILSASVTRARVSMTPLTLTRPPAIQRHLAPRTHRGVRRTLCSFSLSAVEGGGALWRFLPGMTCPAPRRAALGGAFTAPVPRSARRGTRRRRTLPRSSRCRSEIRRADLRRIPDPRPRVPLRSVRSAPGFPAASAVRRGS